MHLSVSCGGGFELIAIGMLLVSNAVVKDDEEEHECAHTRAVLVDLVFH